MPRASSSRVDPPDAVSIHGRAADDLRFIRSAMERGSTFTAVPGAGGAAMGVIALVAAAAGAMQPTAERWLAVWLLAAIVAVAVGLWALVRKAMRAGVPVTGTLGRRFAMGLAAPLVAGAALTFGLWLHGAWALMPTVWLLLYGVGVLTGGVFSVAPLRLLGLAFMLLGLIALLTPASWGNVWMAVGFGVLQIGFGAYIARVHGG